MIFKYLDDMEIFESAKASKTLQDLLRCTESPRINSLR